MENIAIKKFKLNSRGGADVTYVDSNGNERVLKGTHPIQLLEFAVDALAPYITYFTEQKEASSLDWADISKGYSGSLCLPTSVTGMSKQQNKIQLTGTRKLLKGGEIPVTSPMIDLETLRYDFGYHSAFEKCLQVLDSNLKVYVSRAQEKTLEQAERELAEVLHADDVDIDVRIE